MAWWPGFLTKPPSSQQLRSGGHLGLAAPHSSGLL